MSLFVNSHIPQIGCFWKAAKRPAHGVRNNRSPMQAPVRARSIGSGAPHDFAPVGRNKKPMRFFLGTIAKLVCLLCLLFSLNAYCALSHEESATLLREAERCFDDGNEAAAVSHERAMENWRKAVSRYEKVIKEGNIVNGALYYNLGNAYFRLGDMGNAIANYRRAERLIPCDANVQKNLAYARRNCQDNIQEPESKKVLKTLFFWHYDFPLGVRELLFVIGFCGFCLFGCLRLKLRRTWLSGIMGACALLAVVMAASMLVTELGERRTTYGVIVASEVEGRKGNSESYDKSFQAPLHAGTEFRLLETRGNWVEIQLADNQTCWLPAEATVLIQAISN